MVVTLVTTLLLKERYPLPVWVGVLAGSQQMPWKIERALTLEKDFASITAAELNKAAAKYLRAKKSQELFIKGTAPAKAK